MKKFLFIILVPLLMTVGLTGCYTELLTTNATLASDNPDNTIIIYCPAPVVPYIPPSPAPPPMWVVPQAPPNNLDNKRDTKRSETTLRNDNGGRGSEPRNGLTTPSRTRIEPTNTNASGSSNNSNGNRVESANSGNNSSSRSGNANDNTVRNGNGSRNTGGGR